MSVESGGGAASRVRPGGGGECARPSEWSGSMEYMEENYEALEGADALLLLTEWPLFRRPDFPRMKELLKTPLIFDGRNQYSPPAMKSMGFEYVCIGRG